MDRASSRPEEETLREGRDQNSIASHHFPTLPAPRPGAPTGFVDSPGVDRVTASWLSTLSGAWQCQPSYMLPTPQSFRPESCSGSCTTEGLQGAQAILACWVQLPHPGPLLLLCLREKKLILQAPRALLSWSWNHCMTKCGPVRSATSSGTSEPPLTCLNTPFPGFYSERAEHQAGVPSSVSHVPAC